MPKQRPIVFIELIDKDPYNSASDRNEHAEKNYFFIVEKMREHQPLHRIFRANLKGQDK